MEIKGFKILKQNIHNIPEGVKTHTCPLCSHTRKKKSDKCAKVNWEIGLLKCFHCGEIVQLHEFEKKTKSENYKIPEWQNNTKLSDNLIKWLEGRNISQFISRLMKISEGLFDMPDKTGWKKKNTIQFPYYRNGQLVNVKYRGGDKSFRFLAGCELMPYNLDNIQGQKIIYLVEGEMDVLAVMETGLHNVASPPNGFTEKGNINLDWLNNDIETFLNADKLILAFDNDKPGQNGKKEFIRRFGAHKCFTVDLKDCKDSNDYSIKYGKEELKKALENHIEIPLEEISTYSEYKEQVRDFFINGMPKGMISKTLPGLDDNFSVNTGQLVLVTGRPGSGKSEVADQLVVSYSVNYNYNVAFASPENKPNQLHHQKLVRKLSGVTPKEKHHFNMKFEACEKYLDEHFFMIDIENGYDLDRVLMKAEELIYRRGIRILVIDPYNKVRLKSKIESVTGNRINDYTAEYLTRLNDFAVKFDILILLIAHPVKLQKQENGKRVIPDFYDVKGGGEFYDMCHHGLVVERDFDLGYTLIRTLKVKFQHLGEANKDSWFKYNVNNGRYSNVSGDVTDPSNNINIEFDNTNWVTDGKEDEQLEIHEQIEPNTDFDNEKNWYDQETKEVPF